jgi:tRNA (cytidine/uridine-2'-O-)-methyltransferase|tara:strand:- start:89 stop:541 length:453 start_codon:yes stop_codon:yes gene_type:complete
MIDVALYNPDIPQNTAAIIRLCACFNIKLHIIEPCGFNFEDSRFKKVVMDYINLCKIVRYNSYQDFEKKNSKSRFVLLTTKANNRYDLFKFNKKDILLFGRESAGVPDMIHKKIKNKIKIPLDNSARSFNIVTSAAISVSEALRQNNFFK